MVLNYETVIYAFEFLVPGFIIASFQEIVMLTKVYSDNEKIIHAIGYSVLNLCAWLWLFLLIRQNIVGDVCYWFVHSLAIFATSCITGIVLGLFKRKKFKFIKWVFSLFKITIVHPIPRAWDYIFSKGKGCWIEVFLENGKIVRGYYSNKSFASSDYSYNDIYIEEIYIKPEGKKWEKIPGTSGIWISPSEIKYIKFYEMEDDESE